MNTDLKSHLKPEEAERLDEIQSTRRALTAETKRIGNRVWIRMKRASQSKALITAGGDNGRE